LLSQLIAFGPVKKFGKVQSSLSSDGTVEPGLLTNWKLSIQRTLLIVRKENTGNKVVQEWKELVVCG